MNNEIEEGDIVSVNFHGSKMTLTNKAVVNRRPRDTGDSWRFECKETGSINYVSEGCTVKLLEKGADYD
jgi:hypothetical protein